ncbi:RBPJ-interacting and tubulin-associated protein 1 [Gracilinanus agilis]|uniref:RBPJ-interacting and tubulin-associated protein 1 n=1 Tax=Gracilinanus agilis TaxID=191870 RepID=UPI001CFDF685|nr:RBPJ-interacting and tubulin-associated protein 1 [Gracilinanus agilis]
MSNITKASVELTINGIQALQLQHRGLSGYRVKYSTSFVDETLFGRPLGARPDPPEFDPPWAEKAKPRKAVPLTLNKKEVKWNPDSYPCRGSSSIPPPSTDNNCISPPTPGKKNKYRLISHKSSYCDETLFGTQEKGSPRKVPWIKMEEIPRLEPLFWTPPSVPGSSCSPHPKETPLWTIRSMVSSVPKNRSKSDIWHRPLEELDSVDPLQKGSSQSLTHLNGSPTRHSLTTKTPHQGRQREAWVQSALVIFQSPLATPTPRTRSVSFSEPVSHRKYLATPKPKPPWK